MTNPGSIIATTSDYRRRARSLRTDLLGAHLRSNLATKTFLFVGYSFGDDDFNQIYRFLHRDTAGAMPRSVIVTLSEEDPKILREGSVVIRTDATYFLERLKAAVPSSEFVEERILMASGTMAQLVRSAHHKMLSELRPTDYPAVVYAAAYQDGLMHAFDHQEANRGLGDYWHSCYVRDLG